MHPKFQCIVPENIYTSLWKFQPSFIHFYKYFGLPETPTPQEVPIASVEGVWIFSGTVQYFDDLLVFVTFFATFPWWAYVTVGSENYTTCKFVHNLVHKKDAVKEVPFCLQSRYSSINPRSDSGVHSYFLRFTVNLVSMSVSIFFRACAPVFSLLLQLFVQNRKVME